MAVELKEAAVEGGSYGIEITCRDIARDLAIPNSLAYTLTDERGRVINDKADVPLQLLAQQILILQDNDLMFIPGVSLERYVLVSGDYDSSEGTGITLKGECMFMLELLESSPPVE